MKSRCGEDEALRLALCLLLISACSAAPAAAPPVIASASGKPEEVFGLAKVWTIHLTISAKDWDNMHPTRGGFGRPAPDDKTKPLTDDRKPRGGFGFDFEYVRGQVSINGAIL